MNNKSDRGMKSGWLKCLWYMLLAFLLTGYIVVPFFCTVIKAFETESGYGIGNIQEYLSNPNQLRVIGNTVLLGAASVNRAGSLYDIPGRQGEEGRAYSSSEPDDDSGCYCRDRI